MDPTFANLFTDVWNQGILRPMINSLVFSFDSILSAIKAPTLLMQADPEVGAAVLDEHALRAMKLLSNARHIKYEGIGHGIHAALPEKTVADMEAFVAGTVGTIT